MEQARISYHTLVFVFKALLCVWLVENHVTKVLARVEPLSQLPPELQGYLDICHSTGDLTQHTGKLVFWTSINQYISKFVQSRPDLTPQQAQYLQDNLQDALYPVYQHATTPTGRKKRQVIGGQRRIRREIRVLSVQERARYYAAVNAMKRDRRLPPNVYDFLAAYHQGANVQRAHLGPAFPGWHRLYLWIFEHFLRLQDSTVSIPYWASVLDNDMVDPTQTVLFSPGFYGNGDGAPRTGPFRDWPSINPQTVFTRNVQRGQLYSYDGIQRILSRRRNSEILFPTAFANSNLEQQHAGPHVFVGGTMNNLNAAARDPIFFSHHSFVDQIWERFRTNQRRFGINPETDYPFDPLDPRFRASHNPDATAGFSGLPATENWIQRLGYLNVFSDLVGYEDVPSCPSCSNSPYLFCNFNLNPPRCVSRTTAEVGGSFFVGDISTLTGSISAGQTSAGFQETFDSTIWPSNSSTYMCPMRTYVNDVPTTTYSSYYDLSSSGPGYDWSYIPIKVVYKRPREYHGFPQYSMYHDRPGTYRGYKGQLASTGLQDHYECCERMQDAVGKISIVSYGLNYDGSAEEYVILDNRLAVAEGNAYLPVKRPTGSNYCDVMIAAFDSCGRVCKPYYHRRNSRGEVEEYPFSGGIRVTSDPPYQYGESYTDAMYNTWDVPTSSSCPKLKTDNIPISFFCEYTDPWIWNASYELPPYNLRPPPTYYPSPSPAADHYPNPGYEGPHGPGSYRELYEQRSYDVSRDVQYPAGRQHDTVNSVPNDRGYGVKHGAPDVPYRPSGASHDPYYVDSNRYPADFPPSYNNQDNGNTGYRGQVGSEYVKGENPSSGYRPSQSGGTSYGNHSGGNNGNGNGGPSGYVEKGYVENGDANSYKGAYDDASNAYGSGQGGGSGPVSGYDGGPKHTHGDTYNTTGHVVNGGKTPDS